MKIKPVNDRVLVHLSKSETVTEGGLHIPDAHQKKARYGEVLAIGPGRFRENSNERIPVTKDIQVGSVVRFVPFGGDDLDHFEPGFLMLREDQIDAVVVEP